jgi:hypothetical protein
MEKQLDTIKSQMNWLKWGRGGGTQEGNLWTYLKNMGERDHTTGVEIWHNMSNSKERGQDDMQ